MKISFFKRARIVLMDLMFVPLLLLCIMNSTLSVYLLRLGKGQLNIIWNSRPVKEVLIDPAVSDSVKTKLKLVNEIRQFAFDSIGLTRNDNYTTYYDQKGKRLMYVVTACPPFELQPHQWHFPFLGDVPYKGFFQKEKAEEERLHWKRLGYDCDIGGASGWSTLGYLKDPVLSQMLQYEEGDLAELIIHELTHGTLFVPDSVTFNENLASFVGYKGALWFLERKYGKESKQYTAYINGRKDEKLLNDFMLSSAHTLDSLYKTFKSTMTLDQKQHAKHDLLMTIVERAGQLSFASDSTFHKRLKARINRSGNCMFLQYVRYEVKQNDFEIEFGRFRGLKAYVQYLEKKYPSV